MLKVVTGVLMLAALAGCAGSKMKDARTGAPYKAMASDKASLVVAECIQFGWQDESVFGVDAGGFKQPLEAGGFTVYTTAGDYFVDVQNAGTGSTVKYYAAQDNMPAKRRLAALATCL
jgi:L-arabinose isomerase